jgi:hypothetical protein
MSKQPSPHAFVQASTVAMQLRAPDSSVRPAINRLTSIGPPPLDCAGLLAACVGASGCVAAAVSILKQPNAIALAIKEELKALAIGCIELYERGSLSDAEEFVSGRSAGHPAWCAFSAAGRTADLAEHPAAVALGAELCLCWVSGKKAAVAFATGAAAALNNDELRLLHLPDMFHPEEGVRLPGWLKHSRSVYTDFLAEFETAPPPPPEPPTFEERAKTELRCRAAFASFRRRAGILDDTCLSRRQISEALEYGFPGIFDSVAQRRAALWILGVSGLFGSSVHLIPVAGAQVDDWVIFYDPTTGTLHRDYRCVAPDAARARPGEHTPASYCALTPAPIEVWETLACAAATRPDARNLGDLLPALRRLNTRDPLYPDLADLSPSIARWGRSLAPLALQIGTDSLLVAITAGDFGITARSKIHYCAVTTKELHTAAAALYEALGWGQPMPMPPAALAFGSAVVPPAAVLQRLDAKWVGLTNEMRPAHRLKTEATLLAFHNQYVLALAARLCVWLSLRAATKLSLTACIDESTDLCIDLNEKGSAHRSGGMAAVVCAALRAALKTYFAHCAALLDRLQGFCWDGPVIDWLRAIGRREAVPLLCKIPSRRAPIPIGTADILRLPGAADLAPDFGRKFVENFLRQAGARWPDIDRHQRHEVKGQEQDTTISDSTEADWAERVSPFLDEMSDALFSAPLYGLRRPGVSE